MPRVAAALLFLAVLGGCYVIDVQFGQPRGEVSVFTVDETTYEDVLDLWGAPVSISKAGEGFCFLYGYVDYDDVLFAFREPVTSLNFVHDTSDRRFFMDYLLFDGKGVLKDALKLNRKTRMGGGTSLRPKMDDPLAEFFANNPIENPWGGALLQPITRVLNYCNTLRYGENGTEIFGTPSGAGQNTLERPQ